MPLVRLAATDEAYAPKLQAAADVMLPAIRFSIPTPRLMPKRCLTDTPAPSIPPLRLSIAYRHVSSALQRPRSTNQGLRATLRRFEVIIEVHKGTRCTQVTRNITTHGIQRHPQSPRTWQPASSAQAQFRFPLHRSLRGKVAGLTPDAKAESRDWPRRTQRDQQIREAVNRLNGFAALPRMRWLFSGRKRAVHGVHNLAHAEVATARLVSKDYRTFPLPKLSRRYSSANSVTSRPSPSFTPHQFLWAEANGLLPPHGPERDRWKVTWENLFALRMEWHDALTDGDKRQLVVSPFLEEILDAVTRSRAISLVKRPGHKRWPMSAVRPRPSG